MKKAEIIDVFTPKEIPNSFSLNKVLKVLKENLDALEPLLDGFPLPSFQKFRIHFCNHESKLFTIEEALLVLIAYSRNEIHDFELKSPDHINSCEIQERVNSILIGKKKRFKLNRLRKELILLGNKNPDVLKTILKSKPFPTFNQFKASFCNFNDEQFSVEQGVNILYAYAKNEIHDFNRIPDAELRNRRIEKQNKKLKKLDDKGLLGLNSTSNSAVSKAKKNSRYRKSNSVWTVKK